ncbi:hypothetical protein [Roseobacter sp. OBYS 0001]|uniref:hypothetical protein n=1 Tax=Roseobacter sp. OBYS 0001 TaxID=882651 RepID=UPI001BC77376|nr:hypothetical protein [Roseobacter sp. OBYS 0001]GIT86128.1 hypothetical protein ROBYS_11440 [Roseobacter sp. OBYS 0001]
MFYVSKVLGCNKQSSWYLTKKTIGAPIALLAATVSPTATEVAIRGECRKTIDSGCTFSAYVGFNAPAGHYIVRDYILAGTVVNSDNRRGHRPLCDPREPDATVPFPVPGMDIVADLNVSGKAILHVESGSGFGDLNQVFFVNYKYTYQTKPIP